MTVEGYDLTPGELRLLRVMAVHPAQYAAEVRTGVRVYYIGGRLASLACWSPEELHRLADLGLVKVVAPALPTRWWPTLEGLRVADASHSEG